MPELPCAMLKASQEILDFERRIKIKLESARVLRHAVYLA